MAYRFESGHRHQTNIIRTKSSQWEMGSDYLFSSEDSRKRISETVSSNDRNQSREPTEKETDLEDTVMDKMVISCEFNIDTACVEVRFVDGSMISVDCTLVEAEVARNMYESSEQE